MTTGRKRQRFLLPLVAVLSITVAFLLSGCLWGVVRDADTGAPLPGVTVAYTDSEGRTDSTTTDANGLYAFDIATGPVPAAGPASFQLSDLSYDPLTAPRLIEYNDNPEASPDNLSSVWEIQHFNLARQKVQWIDVELLGVDVTKALLAPPIPILTQYRVVGRVFDPPDLSLAGYEQTSGWFPITMPDPAPQPLSGFGCGGQQDDFRIEVTVELQRFWQNPMPPFQQFPPDTDISTAAFDWVPPSPSTAWQTATIHSTDMAGPDDPDLEFTADIRFRATFGPPAAISDRNLKENFTPADGQEVLTRLAGIPISTWNYKDDDDSIRHMGPMAQDFYAAFGLGDDDRRIYTIDADGVAMAAIQALYHLVRDKDAEIAALQEQNANLETRLRVLERAVSDLLERP